MSTVQRPLTDLLFCQSLHWNTYIIGEIVETCIVELEMPLSWKTTLETMAIEDGYPDLNSYLIDAIREDFICLDELEQPE